MNIPVDRVFYEIDQILDQIVTYRKSLHQIPEAGFSEFETASFIKKCLDSFGVDYEDGYAETGIVAVVHGKCEGDAVAFRADIDGVSQVDSSEEDHASKNPGFGHSCGHDGHTACLLGVIKVLKELRDTFDGEIQFIFQPGEETGTGSKVMLNDGLFDKVKPKCIFALHSWPFLKEGSVGSKNGFLTSGNEAFEVTLKGGGGHGARHYETDNPINCASKIIPELYKLTDITTDDTTVVSVGYVHSGEAPNVIPEKLVFGGTVRTTSSKSRKKVLADFEKIISEECEFEGVECSIKFHGHCPPVVNNPKLYRLFCDVATEVLGEDKVFSLEKHSTGSEDFSFFGEHMPSFMFRLGLGKKGGSLHSCRFDFNDDALRSGIAVSTCLLLSAVDVDFTLDEGV